MLRYNAVFIGLVAYFTVLQVTQSRNPKYQAYLVKSGMVDHVWIRYGEFLLHICLRLILKRDMSLR